MRGLIQRVRSASVVIDHPCGDREVAGEIGVGLCVLVGVAHDDDERSADALAAKTWNLRIFDDPDGTMNLSAADLGLEVLVVSQFTLYGDTRKGRRPSYVAAARPEVAEPLVDRVVDQLRLAGATVATGRFRTDMAVSLVNDGPVTLLVET